MISLARLSRAVVGGNFGRLAYFSALARDGSARKLLPFATYTIQAPIRGFSRSAIYKIAATADDELLSKLQSELQFEEAVEKDSEMSDVITRYLAQGVFKVEDKVGMEEVVLKRNFGNENIRLSVNVSDIVSNGEGSDSERDHMLDDEDNMIESANNQPAEQNETAEDEDDVDEPLPGGIRAIITISKANFGALAIEANISGNAFYFERIAHFSSGSKALDNTPEGDSDRLRYYNGPSFKYLDEDLQEVWIRYFEARGFDSELAAFIPEYLIYKEQKSYEHWLSTLTKFVSE